MYLSSLPFALISAQCVLLFLSAQVETLTEAQQAIVDLAFGQLAAGNGCYGQVEKVHNFKQQASCSLDHFQRNFADFPDHPLRNRPARLVPLDRPRKKDLLLVRITVCIESFLPTGWRTFIWRKNPPKCCTILVRIAGCWSSANILLTSSNPKSNLLTLPHLYKPLSEQAKGWIHFCMKRLRTLKSFQIF